MPQKRKTIYTLFVKRMLDIIISGIAIIILSPLLIILSIMELVIHGKPIVYTQERPGLNGRIFHIYKFRSMTNETDENGELLPGDKRVTKFGKFLRRFSLDELPELFCILMGEMSIIGPRPLLTKYLPLYSERHKHRHDIRPGLTIESLKKIDTWTWNDQFENDIWYVEHCSFIVDCKMIVVVAKEAIFGSEYRVNDTREEFTGYNLYSNAKAGVEK